LTSYHDVGFSGDSLRYVLKGLKTDCLLQILKVNTLTEWSDLEVFASDCLRIENRKFTKKLTGAENSLGGRNSAPVTIVMLLGTRRQTNESLKLHANNAQHPLELLCDNSPLGIKPILGRGFPIRRCDDACFPPALSTHHGTFGKVPAVA